MGEVGTAHGAHSKKPRHRLDHISLIVLLRAQAPQLGCGPGFLGRNYSPHFYPLIWYNLLL